jgi:hypothetical protein
LWCQASLKTMKTVLYFRSIDPRKAAVATEVITVTKPGLRGLIECQHAAVHLASAAGGLGPNELTGQVGPGANLNKFAHEMNSWHLLLITARLALRLENSVRGMIEGTSKTTQVRQMIGLYPT